METNTKPVPLAPSQMLLNGSGSGWGAAAVRLPTRWAWGLSGNTGSHALSP